jgi:hypothetical protein
MGWAAETQAWRGLRVADVELFAPKWLAMAFQCTDMVRSAGVMVFLIKACTISAIIRAPVF